MNKLLMAATFAASLLIAAPASAVTLLDTDCSLSAGCLFDGNDNDPAAIETAYNSVHAPPPLDLPSVFTAIESSGELLSTTWSSVTPISYISVKAGNEFMLYLLGSPATSGTITSAGLLGPQGQQQGISHFTLWGTIGAVPEPATWVMMILGFGMVGFGLRMTRQTQARLSRA